MVDTNFQINDNSEAKPKSTTFTTLRLMLYIARYFMILNINVYSTEKKNRKEKKRKDLLDGFIRRSILNGTAHCEQVHLFFGK